MNASWSAGLTLLAAAALVGCPDANKTETKTEAKTGEGGPGAKPAFGAESPEAVYAKLQELAAKDVDDLPAMASSFPYLARSSRVRTLGSMYQAAAFATMTKQGKEDPKKLEQLRGICVRHGAKLGALKDEKPLKSRERLQKMFGEIPDAHELMQELSAFAVKHGKKEAKRTRPRFEGKLQDPKVEGNTATAKAKIIAQGKTRIETLTFVKEDGRWFWQLPGVGK